MVSVDVKPHVSFLPQSGDRGKETVKEDVRSGVRDDEFLWLTPGEAMSSCQCPLGRIQVEKDTFFFNSAQNGSLVTVLLSSRLRLKFQFGDWELRRWLWPSGRAALDCFKRKGETLLITV